MLTDPPLYRPPAEAYSLILRVTYGCPWNRCDFCGMYKGVKYEPLNRQDMEKLVDDAARRHPSASRLFLADGDVMGLPPDLLDPLLQRIRDRFPRLARVNLYANGHSILEKGDERLACWRRLKLHTLYMGLESGDDVTLQRMHKRESSGEMLQAAQMAQSAGLKMSVMVLIGLGGTERSDEHVAATADVLNRMQPRLLSALRVIPVPGTPLGRDAAEGRFQMLSAHAAVRELRDLVDKLDLKRTVFRANHSSNLLPLEGRFPADKERLLAECDELLASGELPENSPGPLPLSL